MNQTTDANPPVAMIPIINSPTKPCCKRLKASIKALNKMNVGIAIHTIFPITPPSDD